MIIKHQVAINATKNVKEKLTFEREDKSKGLIINVHHTEIGIFNTSNFMEELFKKQQKISFSGARSSHQNGAAERAIKMVVATASNMFMNAALICHEDTFSTDIWPMEI